MVHYPQHFQSKTTAHPGIKENWTSEVSEHQITCSIPTQYEGTGEAYSPEDLFLLSLQNCFVATFKIYSDHMHLEFDTLSVSADLIVDLEDSKGPVMKKVELIIELTGVKDEELAQDLVSRSLKDGFIFQSVSTEIKSRVSLA